MKNAGISFTLAPIRINGTLLASSARGARR